MKDLIKMIGDVNFKLTRANGTIEEFGENNLVVTVGRNHIADQLSDKGEAAMSHMAIGTGTTLQVLANTSLQTEISRKAFTTKAQGTGSDLNKIIYTAEWAPGEGTGAITEAGIFNSATAGTMLSRTTFSVKNKDVGDTLTIQWTLTITG